MLAIAAALAFLLRLLSVTLGTVDLVVLGLFLLALHFAVGGYIPIPWNRGPRA
jgi:hypothetical protein